MSSQVCLLGERLPFLLHRVSPPTCSSGHPFSRSPQDIPLNHHTLIASRFPSTLTFSHWLHPFLSSQVLHTTVLATPQIVILCIAWVYSMDKPFKGPADSSCFHHPLTQHQDLPSSFLSWHYSHLLLKHLLTVKSNETSSTFILPSSCNGAALLTMGFLNRCFRALGHHQLQALGTSLPPRPLPQASALIPPTFLSDFRLFSEFLLPPMDSSTELNI